MVIAEIVWETWREREGAFKKPSIALFLNTETPSETALKALSRAASEVMRPRLAKAETAGPGEEEFRTGNCASVRVPQGVVLQIDEGPDDFEGLLRGIAEGLRARGVDGGFDLYEFEGVAEIPERVDLFECHLRLNGESVDGWKWKPDPEAVARAVEAGIAWCGGNSTGFPLSVEVGLLPPFLLRAEDDVHGYVREAVERTTELGSGPVRVTSAAPDRSRTFAITASFGRVGLIEGGAAVKEDWQSSVAHLIEAMRESAPWCVYGFVSEARS